MSLVQNDLINLELEKLGIREFNLEEFVMDYDKLIEFEEIFDGNYSVDNPDSVIQLITSEDVTELLNKLDNLLLSCNHTLRCATTERNNIIFGGKTYYHISQELPRIGTYNEVLLYTDGITNKQYVIKQNKKQDYDEYVYPQIKKFQKILDRIKSFYENLKHIILTILITNTYQDLKLMPKIYDIGYIQEEPELPRPPNTTSSSVGGTIFIVMEYEKTLDDEIENNIKNNIKLDIQKINKYLYSVYKGLELINSITPPIHFRHGDLKANNLLITEDFKPVMIDFGFCEFEIDSRIKFKSSYKITNYWNFYQHFYQHKYEININNEAMRLAKPRDQILDMLNSTHDMFQLIYSLLFIMGNDYSEIFASNTQIKYFLNVSSIKSIKKNFLMTYQMDLLEYINEYKLVEADGLKQFISLDSISFNQMDLFAKYNFKYIKYKKKYLELKALV